MSFVNASKNSFSVNAYIGDKKTLLAFNFQSVKRRRNIPGFTIFCQPPGQVAGYFLKTIFASRIPANTGRSQASWPNSTVNAPVQKYRWTHYPGTAHQGLSPAFGDYTYTVTPRYFDANGSMQALDSS